MERSAWLVDDQGPNEEGPLVVFSSLQTRAVFSPLQPGSPLALHQEPF